MRNFLTIVLAILLPHSPTFSQESPLRPSEYVSTLVGTLSDYSFSAGNTYPAIALPWGMNFWTPQTGKMGNSWIYTYSSQLICGFKQTHQPSPWIGDYGQFSIMPVRGNDKLDEESRKSWFSHQTEEARPYYYKVYLADHDITAEITPTDRAALMRFTFPLSDESGIILDAFDKGSMIQVLDDNTIVGYTTCNSGGVPANFKNWFVAQFDKPFNHVKLYDGSTPMGTKKAEGDHALIRLGFSTHRGEQINVRVASSFISQEQAFINLKEVGEENLETIKTKAQNRWDEVLGRIEVQGGTSDQYKTFYSCLYRATLFPRKFYEIDRSGKPIHYSPYNGKVLSGYLYTDNGFWDTFRSLFPLLNLVYPSVNKEIQSGLANTYRESGFLPEWASPGHRDCMVGNNSASIVSDAIVKGITSPTDVRILYEAMLHGRTHVHPKISSTGRLGHEYYNKLGYVPCDININESAARTLEYAYDDWCIAQVAKLLGEERDAAMLTAASKNFRNLFDSTSKLMRGRNADGSFHTPFNPYQWGEAFTEGNAWHYTWSVFHDIEGLATLMGGKEAFSKMLDSVFLSPPLYDDSYYGRRIHEITEMLVANMGNYAHGNQPAQHIIYLYDYVDQPRKTQWWVREVMDRLYSAQPNGYCGDEDNGQTSAWYIFSALGFYPVCPVADEYAVGSPLFQAATIHLENGKQIHIMAPGNTPSTRYTNEIRVNGEKLSTPFLRYSELKQGTSICFDFSPITSKQKEE